VKSTNTPASNPNTISISGTGQYQTWIINGSDMYNSSNYGSNWSQNTSAPTRARYSGLAISQSGQYQTVTAAYSSGYTNYGIYTSSNFGSTWSYAISEMSYLGQVTMSASGQYQMYVATTGEAYLSSNYGSSWTRNYDAPGGGVKLSMSASGQYITVCVYNGYMYNSSSYGSTWSINSSASNTAKWIGISLSASGQYQTAVVADGGSIYNSSNYGSTWSQNTTAANTYWQSVSVSASGQYQCACWGYATNTGNIYTSSNYGSTWSQSSLTVSSAYWSFALMSKSGQYFFALNYADVGWYICKNSISNGIVNVGNYTTANAVTSGITGGLYYNTTSSNLWVSNGSAWSTVKSFVIDHPDDPSKYLVHGCLEGPESGVYYRGSGEITNNDSVTMNLPDYVRNLAGEFTVKITPIYDGNRDKGQYFSSRVTNNKFTVYGPNGKFSWHINGKRININVEPYKNTVLPKGDGPYQWL
jgi:hypothetical protein